MHSKNRVYLFWLILIKLSQWKNENSKKNYFLCLFGNDPIWDHWEYTVPKSHEFYISTKMLDAVYMTTFLTFTHETDDFMLRRALIACKSYVTHAET